MVYIYFGYELIIMVFVYIYFVYIYFVYIFELHLVFGLKLICIGISRLDCKISV